MIPDLNCASVMTPTVLGESKEGLSLFSRFGKSTLNTAFDKDDMKKPRKLRALPEFNNVASVPGIAESSDSDSSEYELPPGLANRADAGVVALPGLIKEKINKIKAAEMAEHE